MCVAFDRARQNVVVFGFGVVVLRNLDNKKYMHVIMNQIPMIAKTLGGRRTTVKGIHWLLVLASAAIAVGAWANYSEHPTAKNLKRAVIDSLEI
jgi:hypothetical protein